MKNVIFLTIIIIIIGCSKEEEKPEEFPLVGYISNWVWPGVGIDRVIVISHSDNEKETDVDMTISIFNEIPYFCELKFEGNTVMLIDDSNYEEYWYVEAMGGNTGYFLWVDNNDIPYLNSFYEGQSLEFSLKINDKTNSGSLIIPYQLMGTFPTFLITTDYTFEWGIQENPDLYYVFFEIDDSSYEPVVYESWQIDGNLREYTISKSLYQNLTGLGEYDMVCVIDAMNYYRDDDFLAFSYKRDYYEQGDGLTTTMKKKKHTIDLINQVIKDDTKFTEK